MKVRKTQSVLALKPTQFAIGMMEIQHKVMRLKAMSKKKLGKFLRKRPIPIVISPWGELCVTDHHHLLFACWHAGIRKVRVKVIRDFSNETMSYVQFWKKMSHLNLAYPYDQFGAGPHEPLYLPIDVRGMADDPYRSLAWMVRKEGGYENSEETFAEFKWADFFRKRHLLAKQGRSGFKAALKRGLKLAQSSEAKDLPGYVNRREIAETIERIAKEQSKYIVGGKKSVALKVVPHAVQ